VKAIALCTPSPNKNIINMVPQQKELAPPTREDIILLNDFSEQFFNYIKDITRFMLDEITVLY